jgi:YD repeat-containing protein
MERRLTGMIAAAAVLLILFIMWDVFRPAPRAPAPPGPDVVTDPGGPLPSASSQGTAAPATPMMQPGPREPTYNDLLARSETRRRIRANAGSTYLNEMLAASSDSILRRWDDRGIQSPVHVWFAPTYAANFQPAFIDAIRRAFGAWSAAGVPVQFDLDGDSTNAEVVFRWRPQFEIERTGQTDLRWDGEGRIKSATVTLSTFDPKGRAMDADDIRVVAEHEIGHVLGLDHSADSTDLMFPSTKVRDLSDRDVRTVLLLYQLSPGSVR